MSRNLPVLLLCLSVAGCGASYRAGSGPNAGAIRSDVVSPTGQSVPVVELAVAQRSMFPLPPRTPDGAEGDARKAPRGSLARLGKSAADGARLMQGDVIDVTIFDSGEEGLFSSTQSRSLSMGRFTVEPSGDVTMPFVGRQRVVGTSPAAVQTQIVTALRGKAVNPQAVVSVVERPGAVATVDGTVRAPGRFPVGSGATRLLDVIALAGGAQSKPEETTVTVERGRTRASVALDQVLAQNSQNIRIGPGDRIYLAAPSAEDAEKARKSSFTAFGAFKSTGEFDFVAGELTLAEALARTGGLLDEKADPLNLYVFRTQTIGPSDQPGIDGKPRTVLLPLPKPVVIHVNLKDPSNFLHMQSFLMQDSDILYVTNAKSVDLAKYLTVLQSPPPMPAALPPGRS